MKKFLFTAVLLFLGFGAQAPASAQMLQGAQNALEDSGFFGDAADTESDGEEPALELPALPQENPKQAQPQMPTIPNSSEAFFPSLPPSRLCKPRDLIGMWKLMMVYENPTGVEISDFSSSPFQFFIFKKDTTFKSYKSSNADSSNAVVLKKMQNTKSGVLEQYVMHDSGIIYMYKDGVAVNSFACFIVTNKLDPFNVGQMLFMPPPDKATVRMVKIYQKVYGAPKAAPQQQGKKKKNRRGRR